MDVKQRISILPSSMEGMSSSAAGSSQRVGAGISFIQSGGMECGSVTGGSELGRCGPGGDGSQQGTSRAQEHQEAALCMWREWAEKALGPMSAEPSPAQLSSKSNKAKALERKCAGVTSHCLPMYRMQPARLT